MALVFLSENYSTFIPDFFCHNFCDGLSHTKAAHYSFLTAHKTTLKKSYKELLTTQEAHSKKPPSLQPPPPFRLCQKKSG
jgi:hypothetical protein